VLAKITFSGTCAKVILIVTIARLDSQPFHHACEKVLQVLAMRHESQATGKGVYGRSRHTHRVNGNSFAA